jgi:hypothetical protein
MDWMRLVSIFGNSFINYDDSENVFRLVSYIFKHLTKPLSERYIHGYITTDGGGIGVVTCVPYLLKLLDDPGVISSTATPPTSVLMAK